MSNMKRLGLLFLLVCILGIAHCGVISVTQGVPTQEQNRPIQNEEVEQTVENRRGSSNQIFIYPEVHVPHPAPNTFSTVEEGHYFEGDIILRPEQQFGSIQKDLGKKSLRMLWPDGILYYDFSPEFDMNQRVIIERAIYDLQRETCVRFVRRTSEPTYILLRNTKRGCASQVGFNPIGTGIDMYLSSPGCLRTGTIQHEMLHALGFWHEHTRPDRDNFITIFWDNIIPGRELNFRARPQYEPQEWLPYDYNSVMHYRAVAFSKDRLSATIVPKDRKAFLAIGQRVRFSKTDLAKLNILYNCGPGYYNGEDTEVETTTPASDEIKCVTCGKQKPSSSEENSSSNEKDDSLRPSPEDEGSERESDEKLLEESEEDISSYEQSSEVDPMQEFAEDDE